MTLIGKIAKFGAGLVTGLGDQIKQIPGQFVSDQYQKFWNNYYSRRQEQAQKRAEERANAEWWKRFEAQQESQSPANMAKMIREAGGNPLTLFAQGYSPNPANPVGPGLSSPSMPSYDAGASDLFKTVNPRIDNINADTKALWQSTAVGRAQEELLKSQNLSVLQEMRIREFEEKFQEAIQEQRLDKYKAEVDAAIKYLDNLDAEKNKHLAETDYYKQLKNQSVALEALYHFQVDGLGPAQIANLQAGSAHLWSQRKEIETLLQQKYDNLAESTWRLANLSSIDWARLDIENGQLKVNEFLSELQSGKLTFDKLLNWSKFGSGAIMSIIGVILIATGVAAPLGYALLGIGGPATVTSLPGKDAQNSNNLYPSIAK